MRLKTPLTRLQREGRRIALFPRNGKIRGCRFAKLARDQVTTSVDGADPILQFRFAPPLGLERASLSVEILEAILAH
jgi:hypothetical protein